jgi:hypothetical protein
MSAVRSRLAPDCYTSTETRSVDELDVAIGRLVRQMNADSYRLLVLVREFDDRFGWKKWSFKTCAEWLAWRASLSLSAAREKVRAAHALRGLPAISAAFADGRLSYSKVRALTRVAHGCDEDLLLKHALDANVARVEERCRQIRNVAPESAHHARRAWENRSLTMWRDEGRGLLRITVEVPIEDGELIVRALDGAVAAGEVTTDVDPDAVAESKGTAWRARSRLHVPGLPSPALSRRASPETLDPRRRNDPGQYDFVVHLPSSAVARGRLRHRARRRRHATVRHGGRTLDPAQRLSARGFRRRRRRRGGCRPESAT